MKFNCGPTPEERAAARERRRHEREKRLEQWHRKFAWLPVRMGPGDCRWLEFYERRKVRVKRRYYEIEFTYGWRWEVRPLKRS